jgi:sporulation protein YlmC with PRC-barrel domain
MSDDRTFRAAAADRTGESRRLIPSNHAKGALVYAPDGNRLGQIERVMVDEATGEIANAVVRFTFGNSMGIEADEHPVPWSLLAYSSRFDGYVLRITDTQATRRPT